jgi:hypothetical protein
VWQGVIEKDTMWAFPSEGSFKMRLRQVRKNYDKWQDKANFLQGWVREEFDHDKMHEKLANVFDLSIDEEMLSWYESMAEVTECF